MKPPASINSPMPLGFVTVNFFKQNSILSQNSLYQMSGNPEKDTVIFTSLKSKFVILIILCVSIC